MISTEELVEAIIRINRKDPGNEKFSLNDDQLEAILHDEGALWILAGPGTGKTEVLTIRCIKNMLVDDIAPRSIVITTFTKKAAARLIEKISKYMEALREEFKGKYDMSSIAESELRVGTLHSICEDILTRNRYEKFLNTTVIDDIQQRMFVYEHSEYANIKSETPEYNEGADFWKEIHPVLSGFPDIWSVSKVPPKRLRSKNICKLVNLATDYGFTSEKLKKRGEERNDSCLVYISKMMEDYYRKLEKYHLCDQTLIQRYFLDFLETVAGKKFIVGDKGNPLNPGIKCLLVDEYQDTNPIQEMIYFEMCKYLDGKICIVGDDDQALYRFRGGFVEAMTMFDQRVSEHLPGISVTKVQLRSNYRSHNKIVDWINYQISTRNAMMVPGARAPDKMPLIARSEIGSGNGWVAVSKLIPPNDVKKNDAKDYIAEKIVDVIEFLVKNDIATSDQICILQKSTMLDSEKGNVLYKVEQGLKNININTYNPRSKSHHENPIIEEFLGIIMTVLEGGRDTKDFINYGYDETVKYVQRCKARVANMCTRPECKELCNYIDMSKIAIEQSDHGIDMRINYITDEHKLSKDSPTIRDMCYNILNYDYFMRHVENDSPESFAIRDIMTLINAFATLPDTFGESDRDRLHRDKIDRKRVDTWFVRGLYQQVLDIICNEGFDEQDREGLIVPPGHVPILTIHAAKGLEFPIVISILSSTKKGKPEYKLEEFFEVLGGAPTQTRIREEQDAIRLFYVAYSRAQHMLLIVAESSQIKPEEAWGFTRNGVSHTDFVRIFNEEDLI
ncbi:MAG: ATP-dependent helicase [Methanosarcina mazei]|nr:ATP-dependent helicase [Methanosarcina mazei]